MNRRQVDAADRAALDLLRHGEATASQQLRAENGWEHDHASPALCREAMADAVSVDIDTFGGDQVVALVVSHSDAEDLADRIRARLDAAGAFSGPTVTGPGWTGHREYRAGDRVLLHARCGPSASGLVNGTTAAVTAVDEAGLTVRLDRNGATAILPATFVTGTRKDGSPILSHSWARTVADAQGGTWEACHLLGGSALDAYRGYTGQSRSRRPTHTWNTTPITVVNHGGLLADRRDPAEVVADALARQPDPSLAARSDPWTVDRQLREQIAQHEQVLARRPPDHNDQLAEALRQLEGAESWLANMEAIAEGSAQRLSSISPLAGLRSHSRQDRRALQDRLAADTERVKEASERYDQMADQVAQLRRGQVALERFDAVEGWRREEIPRLRDQIDHHWARVIGDCVKADDPLAFGVDKLRHARVTTATDIHNLDTRIPADRSEEWNENRRQLPTVIRAKHEAEQALSDSRVRHEDAGRRRWGRHDRKSLAATSAEVALAAHRLEQAVAAEAALRDRLASVSQHQEQRHRTVVDSVPQRKELETLLAQVDAALDHTRPERVRALAQDPPSYLVSRLGPPPSSPGGQAVWCHHALGIEAVLDRTDGTSPAGTGSTRLNHRTRQEITIADRLLEAGEHASDPAQWAKLADQATGLRDAAHRHLAAQQAQRQRMSRFPQTPWSPVIDNSPDRRGPELSPYQGATTAAGGESRSRGLRPGGLTSVWPLAAASAFRHPAADKRPAYPAFRDDGRSRYWDGHSERYRAAPSEVRYRLHVKRVPRRWVGAVTVAGVGPAELLAGDGSRWRDRHEGVTIRGDLDKEPTRPVVDHRFWSRPSRSGRHPPCRSSERHPADYGAAMAALAPQTVERGRCCQVAGSVVEELARKRARLAPVEGLARGQPSSPLNDAVEAPAAGPGTLMAPRRENHDDRPGVTLRDLLSRKSEPVQGAGSVALDNNVGVVEESVKAVGALRRLQIKDAASLGQQGVREAARGHITMAWRVHS